MSFTEPRCGAYLEDDNTVRWRLWAPKAGRVDLVLIDGPQRRSRRLQPEAHGYFTFAERDIPEGQRYAYRLADGPERPDPCSLWQPDGVHKPSALVFPQRFLWTDQHWRGLPREDLVFYELHVGTFTPEGTFAAIIPRLNSLRDLGVTALEIMPVAQFPGTRNWGYDGVHLFAPQHSYGGPRGLQKLVDACHAAGLAIFLDVVYNHFGPEGNYVSEFAPYYSAKYRTPWGPAFNFDGPDSDPVRSFVVENVRHWIEDYHFDGLRLDAVHAMYDSRQRHVLQEIKETADAAAARHGRRACIVAESLVNDVRMVRRPEQGGHGLDAEWNEDFHHALHAHLTGDRHGKYVDFGSPQDLLKVLERVFVLDGVYSKYRRRRWGSPADALPGACFVIGAQNHDHVGNRALGERLSTLVEPSAQRLAASLTLLAPYVPLLFMGEEYGEENPFLFFCSFENSDLIENVRSGRRRDYELEGSIPDPHEEATFAASRLSWSWPDGSSRAALRFLYQGLLAARRAWPALGDFTRRPARLFPDPVQGPLLEWTRGAGESAVRIVANLGKQAETLSSQAGGRVLFSSEAVRYGGARLDHEAIGNLFPHECVVFAAPVS